MAKNIYQVYELTYDYKNINKIIESTGVSNDENNQISNDSNINNSIAI